MPQRPRALARPPADPVDPRDRRGPHGADRGRPARPDGPRRRGGRRPRRPRRWRWSSRSARPAVAAVAGHRARGRARRHPRRRGARRRRRPSATCSPRSTPACARRSPGWGSAPSRRTSAARCSRRSSSTPTVVARCFPTAPAWPGRIDVRRSRRAPAPRAAAAALAVAGRRRPRTSSRTRASPASGPTARPISSRRGSSTEIQACVGGRAGSTGATTARAATAPRRLGRAADRAVVRDALRVRRPRGDAAVAARRGRGRPLDRAPVRRQSAMSVGALSPEAHQALTIGIQRAGGAANTGEGGEDPAWYAPGPDGERHDARIKQVASARFGVTADVPRPGRPARDQDRPGLEARRGRPAARRARRRRTSPRSAAASPARATSARRRTTTSTRSRTSPSSSPTCARSTRGARIGVKLVAGRGRRHDRRRRRQGRRVVHPPRPATPAGPARRRCRRSSTSGRRGSSAWPRSTRSCSGTTCATASRCAPTAGSRPAATC